MPAQMDDLPPEIKRTIMAVLEWENDVIALALTCRAFYGLLALEKGGRSIVKCGYCLMAPIMNFSSPDNHLFSISLDLNIIAGQEQDKCTNSVTYSNILINNVFALERELIFTVFDMGNETFSSFIRIKKSGPDYVVYVAVNSPEHILPDHQMHRFGTFRFEGELPEIGDQDFPIICPECGLELPLMSESALSYYNILIGAPIDPRIAEFHIRASAVVLSNSSPGLE